MNRETLVRYRYKLLPAALLLAALVVALVYREPLLAWFSGAPGSTGAESATRPVGAAPEAPKNVAERGLVLPRQHFSDPVLASLRAAFDAYEEIRARLAADSLDGAALRAARVAQALEAAASSTQAPRVREVMAHGARAARELEQAEELQAARVAFAEVSRALVALGGADERLSKDMNVFECPMTQGYNKWIQPGDQLLNPYMGQKMLQCGSEVQWTSGSAEVGPAQQPAVGTDEHAHAPGEIAYYTCPMHPSVKQAGPGQCPICGMDLTPVTQHELESGVIIIDAARRQLIGVKTATVEKRPVHKTIRAVGKVTYDEERLVDVSTKFRGWIERLVADSTGMRVKRGETLFTVYSPELYAAQQDLLIASARGEGAGASRFLLESAKRRLRLWDVPAAFIEEVLRKGEPIRNVPIMAPASGFVIEKNIVEGSAVEPGMKLLRIANLDKVWIEAEVYESELPLVSRGQDAVVTLPYLPGKRFEGEVTFVYPYLSGATRTGKVRIELENDQVELKPDMYATVELGADRGERLVVPEPAVIYAGPRRVVFLDLGEGRLRPQEIQVGIKTGDFYEVLEGLSPGDTVVSSGNFLVAAESRLKSAEGSW